MRSLLARFFRDEAATTAIEYAIIACGIRIVVLAAANGIGTNLSGKFAAVSTSLK